MSSAHNTLLRQLAMLRLIPRQPRKIDTGTLLSVLENGGYQVDLRTIQRDLNKWSSVLPLMSDNAKPQGWSWHAGAGQLDIPGLEPQAALAFHMAEEHLRHLLPSSTLAYLRPWFNAARGVLDDHGNGLARWPKKVRVLPRGLPRKAPDMDPAVEAAVTQAVLQERQLEIAYTKNAEQPEPRRHVVHPLALVVRDRIVYLVCVFDGHNDPRQLALHRMQSATVLDATAQRPRGFSIDAYIADGDFGIPLGARPIRLEAVFLQHVAIHLRESPIADDQTLEDVDKDNVLLRATVPDTLELRLWLKSFGDEVEVIKPASLRGEFREIAENLQDYYSE